MRLIVITKHIWLNRLEPAPRPYVYPHFPSLRMIPSPFSLNRPQGRADRTSDRPLSASATASSASSIASWRRASGSPSGGTSG